MKNKSYLSQLDISWTVITLANNFISTTDFFIHFSNSLFDPKFGWKRFYIILDAG